MSDPEPSFALFSGDSYYPYGGWEDFVNVYASLDDARAGISPTDDWAHVVDLETCEMVAEYTHFIGWRSA